MDKNNEAFFQQTEEAILQMEESAKAWCPSGGENVGIIIDRPSSDEWYIQCPTCRVKWAGGSTVLAEHRRPEAA